MAVAEHVVFICHASPDRDVAMAIADSIERRGVACWIAPRDVEPGANYAQSIVEAISASRILVLVYSQSAVDSPHVHREVERAASRHLTILPFRVEDVPPSQALEYFISDTQWIDSPAAPHTAEVERLADVIAAASPAGTPHEPAGARATSSPPPSAGAGPAATLKMLLDRYGDDLARDTRRLSALLKDVMPDRKADMAALVAAAEEGIPDALRSSGGSGHETLERITRRLQENRALERSAARAAVEAWAFGLGIPLADSEAEGRTSRPAGASARSDAPGGRTERAEPAYAPGPAGAIEPETPAPAAAGSAGDGRNRTLAFVAGGVVIVAAIVGAVLAFGGGGGESGGGIVVGPTEVLLEPVGEEGPDPFTGSLTIGRIGINITRVVDPPPRTGQAGAIQAVFGSDVGLYGGTLDNSSCDVDQLVAFLAQ